MTISLTETHLKFTIISEVCGQEAQENRRQEGYRKWERKGWEVGILKGWEAGEVGENYAQCLILVFVIEKRVKGRKPRKTGMGAWNARYGRHDFWTTLSPSPPLDSILSKD